VTRNAVATVIAGLVVLVLPLGGAGSFLAHPLALGLWLGALAGAVAPLLRDPDAGASAVLTTMATVLGAVALYILIRVGAIGSAALGIWVGTILLCIMLWRTLEYIAVLCKTMLGATMRGTAIRLAAPILLGLWALMLWQIVTVGFAIPSVLLPSPGQIGTAIVASLPVLGVDFMQTFVRSMIPGYVIGCGAGFVVGILVDRVPFLQRGLLPIGNLASALPIVGIAPIMVMWFGFDWQSKAAVVAVMTFFPMLVNVIAGLHALGRVERDVMRTYAASYAQTLLQARLPAALPFIFNALKINATLALIGAIVAEFFGTPIYGMGFRISTAAGRMDIALVWATVAVAALSGSAFYGAIALVERRLTFWHPSLRKS
jgi:NitT/TauT family transport system permease protein